MKKLTYILLSASVIFFAGCLKSNTGTTGPTGAAGATGAPGGDLLAIKLPFTLSTSNVVYSNASGTLFWAYKSLPNYNPKYTYAISGIAYRVSTPTAKENWPLPMYGVYTGTDEIFASIGHDSVRVCYSSPTAAPWPLDSVMQVNVVIFPNYTLVQ